jgi:hypothetical protein
MSDWTVLSEDYDVRQSRTSSAWRYDDDGELIWDEVTEGSLRYAGPIYNDTMCLLDDDLCVKDYPFISARESTATGEYDGILALSHGEMNYVKFLTQQK